MRVLYYDCFCGISGDMNIGALIDLGVDKDYLINEISKLKLESENELKITKGVKNGITGTKFDVVLKESDGRRHRNLKDIQNIINSSSLSDNIKKASLNMFVKIAEAEAKVHGRDINEVHFHEVGAIDSIIDIVGAAICLDYLKVDKIMSSTVQVGGGFVKCAHGVLPVPAPATVEILKNIPVKSGLVQFETTTPTGAAILAANVEEFTDKMEFSIEKVGYGLGSRDLEIPNVLRVYLGKEVKTEQTQEQYILETNIDDMNPELYSYVEEKLFEKGALDVYKTQIIMKKGRPAIKLSILVNNEVEKDVVEVLFRETTTIGLRKYSINKMKMDRAYEKVKTKYGEVTIKSAYYNGERVKYKPEFEDCKRAAVENNIPIALVYKEVQKLVDEGLTHGES